MLAMERSGVGPCLSRDSIPLTEKRRHGVVVNDLLELPCTLSFIALAAHNQEPPIECAFEVLKGIWTAQTAQTAQE